MSKSTIIKGLPLTLITAVLGVCVIRYTDICAQGIREGLRLCFGTVIPSLLPFLIVSQFVIESGLDGFLGEIFKKPTRFIFRLSGECSAVILMSLIGGYPVGAKMTAELLNEGKISRYDAQRLNLFCVNAGPAFVIGTVGNIMLRSSRAGLIMYSSAVAASLAVGFLTRFLQLDGKSEAGQTGIIMLREPVSAFTAAVSDAVKTMLSICGWVVIFCALIKCLTCLRQTSAATFLGIILEVTNGVKLSSAGFPLPVTAAVISFGGVAVHCQILNFVSKSGLEIKLFISSRLVSAALSAFFCHLLLMIFPCEISVFSNYGEITADAFSVSLPSAVALIIMCALLIFEVDKDKKIC